MSFDLKAIMKENNLEKAPEPKKLEPLIERDNKGNEIHHKDSNGYEWWREYDDKGRETHYKNSKGYESRTDSKGNELVNYNGEWTLNGEPLRKKKEALENG